MTFAKTCQHCGFPCLPDVAFCSDCILGGHLCDGEPLSRAEVVACVTQDPRVHDDEFESVGGDLYRFTGDPNLPALH